jgi:hypothetical protein
MIDLPFRDVFNNELGYIIGWGAVSYPNNDIPSFLQKAEMRVLSSIVCADLLNFEMHETQFCAFNRERVGGCHVSLLKYKIYILFECSYVLFLSAILQLQFNAHVIA